MRSRRAATSPRWNVPLESTSNVVATAASRVSSSTPSGGHGEVSARNRAAKLSAEWRIALISQDSARVPVFAVRADEELAMAREAAQVLAPRKSSTAS